MKMIGIVGGVGTYAGIDLMRKVCDHSGARTDQEHLPISLVSIPNKIQDRSRFLLNEIAENPADGFAEVISTLYASGARIIGIPCNTAHAPLIFEKIKKSIPPDCKILHLVEEIGNYIIEHYPRIREVGVLATNGTYYSNVYPDVLSGYGLTVIEPDEIVQQTFVHPAIYDHEYGIKSVSNPVTEMAKQNLLFAISHLRKKGARAIAFGCTEIPLAIQSDGDDECIFIDSTTVLAKALVRECKDAV